MCMPELLCRGCRITKRFCECEHYKKQYLIMRYPMVVRGQVCDVCGVIKRFCTCGTYTR